ncbi:MAG: imidazole glycerol phosphate synthase cyclase subunit [bacterium]|nr:imidazole glycerol phosphate synthase cyclase subunit [Candidatus Omnitrophota bacterium]
MNPIRIIPKLEVKGPNLVKGVHLEGLRVLGKPEDFAYKYYLDGADELIYIDVVASLYGRNNLLEIVRKAAQRIFIPLTAGGGVRTLEDINNLLCAGADKVAINTAAVRNPAFVKEAARFFGSQCIVVSIGAKLRGNEKYEAFTDNGREKTDKDVFEWAQEAADLGAGELLITSIDREGTGRGYDLVLIERISAAVPIPVIACGGVGKVKDFLEGIKVGRADAVCAASIFHYHQLKALPNRDSFFKEGNIEFLKKNRGNLDFLSGRLEPAEIQSVKQALLDSGRSCRFVNNFSEIDSREV